QDLANAMRGIHHEFVGLESLTLGQRLLRFLDARRRSDRLGGGGNRLHRGFRNRRLGHGSLFNVSLVNVSLGNSLRSSRSLRGGFGGRGLRRGRFRGSLHSLVWH